MIHKIVKFISQRSRNRRGKIFREYLDPRKEDRILDLGSKDGTYIASVIRYRNNVYMADIDVNALEEGRKKFGFNTLLLDEDSRIPVPDKFFDIVHCSSTIEHITVNKNEVEKYKSSRKFSRVAFEHQRRFANEIRRVGKKYFVQTPNKCFVIKSHTWLPLVNFLPRSILIKIISFLNASTWPKKTQADWNLLCKQQMQELFPDAEIVKEKVLALTKSIMAIKR